jgi:hypothetical protein
MIAHIDRTAEQLSTFRVRPRYQKVLAAHQVPLESSGHEAVDMFSRGYQDLTREVATLLAAVELILEVNRCGTVLSEQFRQFQDRRKPAMPNFSQPNGQQFKCEGISAYPVSPSAMIGRM